MAVVAAHARRVGIASAYNAPRVTPGEHIPQRIAVIGQMQNGVEGSQTEEPFEVTSLSQVVPYGQASPLYQSCKMLLDRSRDGWAAGVPIDAYPLKQGAGSAVYTAAVTFGDVGSVALEPSTLELTIGGISLGQIKVEAGWGPNVVALSVILRSMVDPEWPVGNFFVQDKTLVFIAKFQGSAALGLWVEARWVEGGAGLPLEVRQMAFGSGELDPTTALERIGDKPYTLVLNADVPNNPTALNAYAKWGETRWSSGNPQPAVVFTGANVDPLAESVSAAIYGTVATDRTNAVMATGPSVNAPWQIAAATVGHVATRANANPASDPTNALLDGIRPRFGASGLTYAQRSAIVNGGGGTAVRVGDVFRISDLVTAWRGGSRAFSSVADIVKLQNVIHRLRRLFTADGWISAPLIPDGQTVTALSARQPKAARSAILALLDALALGALIVDVDSTRSSVVAEIAAGNPRRLDVSLTIAISGNVGIVSVDLGFGFYFGG